MIDLLSSYAVTRVRKNLDEILPNDSAMYIPSGGENNENPSLDDIIRRNIPEAINAVHLSAPAPSLIGKTITTFNDVDTDKQVVVDGYGVMEFEINPSESDVLRIVQLKANDSSVVVTEVIAEASREGRKQLNRHIRGRSDRPRLVRLQQNQNRFRYYSLTEESVTEYQGGQTDADDFIERLCYLPTAYYIAPTTTGSSAVPDPAYEIDSERIEQNVIDFLTGLVLETYSMPEKAKVFFDRSTIFH